MRFEKNLNVKMDDAEGVSFQVQGPRKENDFCSLCLVLESDLNASRRSSSGSENHFQMLLSRSLNRIFTAELIPFVNTPAFIS